jgi:lipoic acid synthetase
VSSELLSDMKKMNAQIFTKSGLMVGLGETIDEIYQVMDDLRSANVDFLTIGQYLQPSEKHSKIEKFFSPQEFNVFKKKAYAKGFLMVSSSPLTRSSYNAPNYFKKLKATRETSQ